MMPLVTVQDASRVATMGNAACKANCVKVYTHSEDEAEKTYIERIHSNDCPVRYADGQQHKSDDRVEESGHDVTNGPGEKRETEKGGEKFELTDAGFIGSDTTRCLT